MLSELHQLNDGFVNTFAVLCQMAAIWLHTRELRFLRQDLNALQDDLDALKGHPETEHLAEKPDSDVPGSR